MAKKKALAEPTTQKELEDTLLSLTEQAIEKGLKYEVAILAARRRWLKKLKIKEREESDGTGDDGGDSE